MKLSNEKCEELAKNMAEGIMKAMRESFVNSTSIEERITFRDACICEFNKASGLNLKNLVDEDIWNIIYDIDTPPEERLFYISDAYDEYKKNNIDNVDEDGYVIVYFTNEKSLEIIDDEVRTLSEAGNKAFNIAKTKGISLDKIGVAKVLGMKEKCPR